MRKLLWMIFFFGLYVWSITSGHDRMIMEQGRVVVQALVAWFDDAEIDFQTKENKKSKKKNRRWD
ncbi:MAG: hypothetical protein COT85_02485 [Chlamydiae bacterium CG10_big_fil_rev_8_21_14_0_10_42_34]|nr:MAG: hypothetical protein COT85_02485 [Chlamydiae bacterium CG10_big_fil_rev_8_21_14_0_10_42_34]